MTRLRHQQIVKPLVREVSSHRLLLSNLFRHALERHPLSVFLCGKEPSNVHFDIRHQLAHLLKQQMCCDAFLGEDIPDFKTQAKPDRDHLTIEMDAAKRADIIIMFLGSAGTLAELTAFCLNPDTNQKLLVFNDKKHKGVHSFINMGPLRLIKNSQVVHYVPDSHGMYSDVLRETDWRVALSSFYGRVFRRRYDMDLSFDELMILCIVSCLYPVRYKEIFAVFRRSDRRVTNALGILLERNMVLKTNHIYSPALRLESLGFPAGMQRDIARCRAAAFKRRLLDERVSNDYAKLIDDSSLKES